jgi:hypothetical protein
MTFIFLNQQGLIEEYLFTLKIAYPVFLPVLFDITLIPFKPFNLKKDIHALTSSCILSIYTNELPLSIP